MIKKHSRQWARAIVDDNGGRWG